MSMLAASAYQDMVAAKYDALSQLPCTLHLHTLVCTSKTRRHSMSYIPSSVLTLAFAAGGLPTSHGCCHVLPASLPFPACSSLCFPLCQLAPHVLQRLERERRGVKYVVVCAHLLSFHVVQKHPQCECSESDAVANTMQRSGPVPVPYNHLVEGLEALYTCIQNTHTSIFVCNHTLTT